MLNILPLDGIKILSLEHAIAAPFCTRQLAELGARVIKIERPDGGDFARYYDKRVNGESSHFIWANRSKESVSLDLKSEDGREIFEQILKDTDVLVQNLGPGAAERLGLSYSRLKSKYPKLIVCNISGFGNSGSYSNKKAYDLLIQSESGFLSVTGTKDEIAKAGCSIADIAAGMYAYTNILAALLQRAKTNKGSEIDISMFEAMVEWMGFPLYYSFEGAEPPPRNGAAHASITPYGPYISGDNETIILGVQNNREWERFCNIVLSLPDLIEDDRFCNGTKRTENNQILNEIIKNKFSKLTSKLLLELLDSAGIANAKVNSMNDVWNHKHFKERNRWVTINSPGGKIPALLPPGINSSFDYSIGNIPSLGEHTESNLSELGFSKKEINILKENKII